MWSSGWGSGRLGVGGARRRRGVAGDETQSFSSGVETVAAEDPPDPVRGELEATPLLARQLRTQAVGTPARVGQGQPQHPLLDHRRDRVRHPRLATLARTQHLGAKGEQLPSPAIERRVVDSEHPTGCSDTAQLLGQPEQPQPTTVKHVIIGHGGASSEGGRAPTEWRRRLFPGTTSRCRVYSARGQPRPLIRLHRSHSAVALRQALSRTETTGRLLKEAPPK